MTLGAGVIGCRQRQSRRATKTDTMQTKTTQPEIERILAALRLIHVQPFGHESSDEKWNAQRNLRGRTHYVDDDTLKFHHSRIVGCKILHSGLLLRVTCSDALDMHNTRRGFRSAVFDVFGTCIERPDLDAAARTKQAAITASERQEIDLLAHYRTALADRVRHADEANNENRAALAAIN